MKGSKCTSDNCSIGSSFKIFYSRHCIQWLSLCSILNLNVIKIIPVVGNVMQCTNIWWHTRNRILGGNELEWKIWDILHCININVINVTEITVHTSSQTFTTVDTRKLFRAVFCTVASHRCSHLTCWHRFPSWICRLPFSERMHTAY